MPARVRLTDAAVGKLRARPAEYTVWDTRMAGLGVRVRPTGSRSYVYLGPCHGDARGPRKHTLGPTTTLSADDARRACLDLQTGTRPESARAAANADPPMLFRVFVATEWAPAFLDRYKPSARRGVDAALRSQLLPAFGSYPLHRIHRRMSTGGLTGTARPHPVAPTGRCDCSAPSCSMPCGARFFRATRPAPSDRIHAPGTRAFSRGTRSGSCTSISTQASPNGRPALPRPTSSASSCSRAADGVRSSICAGTKSTAIPSSSATARPDPSRFTSTPRRNAS